MLSWGAKTLFAKRLLGLERKGIQDGKDRGRSRRYLRGAVLGVALSIVPLVVVLVVADGMIEGITARYIEVGTYHLQAQSLYIVPNEELEARADTIASAKGIVGAYPEAESYGIALRENKTAGVFIRAVSPAFLKDKGCSDYLKLESGKIKLDSNNQILLGVALAKNLDAKVGDVVSLVTSSPVSFGSQYSKFTPKVSVFRVEGIVSAGYRQLDELWAFVPYKASNKVFSGGSARQLIGIKVANPYGSLEPARQDVQKLMHSADWGVLTWPEAERNVYKSFETTRALLLLVMALAVAVAAINVSSALIMMVLERRREIAILKSCGAPPGFIREVFLLSGMGLGGIGIVLGLALGCLLSGYINYLILGLETIINAGSRLQALLSGMADAGPSFRLLDPSYYIESIPVHFHGGELLLVAGLSLFLCFLASIIPANKAAKLPPLEIFRKT